MLNEFVSMDCVDLVFQSINIITKNRNVETFSPRSTFYDYASYDSGSFRLFDKMVLDKYYTAGVCSNYLALNMVHGKLPTHHLLCLLNICNEQLWGRPQLWCQFENLDNHDHRCNPKPREKQIREPSIKYVRKIFRKTNITIIYSIIFTERCFPY